MIELIKIADVLNINVFDIENIKRTSELSFKYEISENEAFDIVLEELILEKIRDLVLKVEKL